MLLTPEEVAGILGLSPFTVRRLLRQGELPGRKVGKRQWRIRRADLDEYLGIPNAGQAKVPEVQAQQRLAALQELAKEQGVQPIYDFTKLVSDSGLDGEDDHSEGDVEDFLAPIRLLRESDAARSHS